ncbi:FUSC family protein [Mycolicibacterium fluoranthenivorans]|uniref:F0F1-type ATP synthase assembly protein I n=1 Tax=Mycolicibacterium fluoranthenivorans TaxID=258505 RepID=A0A7X5TWQ6_9MYCO|nr:FUSC family protein [Mycolicibacterium fluoranthenivorans]MCV7356751.1 FUSC family protein [Mycolicibacterium fluoranthenivorans]NIH94143.1 F0F1-type ATP synthase assembly protein I [Mycolicibacterium fluoranthenivorans]
MTEPNDTTSTRPISVAELLAKNGSIGAPSPGGRRRRRRGNADAVTVAELTGEIPIVNFRTDEHQAIDAEQEAIDADVAAEAQSALEPQVTEATTEGATEAAETSETAETSEEAPEDAKVAEEPAEPHEETPEKAAEADYEAHVQQRAAEFEPLVFDPRAHRTHHGLRRSAALPAGGAEEMSPDPLIDDEDVAVESRADTDATAALPSYLRSSADTLFGGDTVADDVARRPRTPGPESIDLDGSDGAATLADTAVVTGDLDEDLDEEPAKTRSPFLTGVWIVAQSIFAVAFGAGLFVAFDQLWKWNNIVALVLSVLVILGLVVGVRVVRRTEDIASTLIAVAVGALVTLGPLALLQST